MPQSVRHALTCILFSVILLNAGRASAQAVGLGIPGIPSSATPGVKVGDGRLHGFFDYELRFDSAAGFFTDRSGNLALSPELISHFRPGLKLEVPASWVNVYLAGYVDYVYYMGALTPGSQRASHLEANADLEVAFNKQGVVEVDVGDTFSRSDRTQSSSIGVGVLSLANSAHLALPIRPGGRALEITPRVNYAIELFQSLSGLPSPNCTDISCDPTQLGLLNYQDIEGGLQVKYKFLPKTAVLVDGSYDTRSYFSHTSLSPGASVLRVTGGLAGLLTNRLTVTARGGWAKDFQNSGGAAFIAQADVNYFITETFNVKAGYQRALDPTPIYGTQRDDRIFAQGEALLGGAFSLRLYASYDWLAFFNNSNRLDHIISVDFGPQYQVLPFFLLGAGYVYTFRDSNNFAASAVNYQRHEAYVRATLSY